MFCQTFLIDTERVWLLIFINSYVSLKRLSARLVWAIWMWLLQVLRVLVFLMFWKYISYWTNISDLTKPSECMSFIHTAQLIEMHITWMEWVYVKNELYMPASKFVWNYFNFYTHEYFCIEWRCLYLTTRETNVFVSISCNIVRYIIVWLLVWFWNILQKVLMLHRHVIIRSLF